MATTHVHRKSMRQHTNGDGILKLENIRARNRARVLELLRRTERLSRADIARGLRCDGTTITRVVRELSRDGLVTSEGFAESSVGRPKEMIALNASHRWTIGVGFEPGMAIGVVCDLRGDIAMRDQLFFDASITQPDFLKLLRGLVERLSARVEAERFLGAGLATHGVLSPEGDQIIQAARFPALDGWRPGEFFRTHFDFEPLIIDGTAARALCEITSNEAAEGEAFLFFNLGAGLGCALAIGGDLFFQKGARTREFGHMTVSSNGALCECGHRGCLETECSIPAIEAAVQNARNSKRLDFDEIVELFHDGDEAVVKVIEAAAETLGVAIANAVNLLLPDAVVVGGDLLKLGDDFFNAVRDAALARAIPVQAKRFTFSRSPLDRESLPLGAAKMVIERFFQPAVSGKTK